MMDFATLIQILDSTLRLATPLLLACLAGLFSERAGIFDIGLEGKMLMAAMASGAVAALTGSVWLGLGAGIVASMLLADLGALVEQIDPGFEDPLEITTGLWFAGAWTVWNTLSPAQQAVADPDFRAQAERGARFSALDIQRLHLQRGALGSQMRQFMQRFDLLVTPSVAVPAFEARPAGHTPMDPVAMLGWTPFSYPFNLTQQPASTVPCGLTSDGLPIGLQFVGPMFGDALVLRASRAYEAARGGHVDFGRPVALRR